MALKQRKCEAEPCDSVQSCVYGAADERVVTRFSSNAKQKLAVCEMLVTCTVF